MEVIGPEQRKRRTVWIGLLAVLLLFSVVLRADRASDVRSQITYVASALGSGNPADALGPFDKSMKDYDRLRDDFQALTDSFDVASEVEVLDEQDGETETKLLVTWALTLTNARRASDLNISTSDRRSQDVTIRLALKNGKWKIVDFSPISLFDPIRK